MQLDFSEFGQQMPLPEAFLEGVAARQRGVPYEMNPYFNDNESPDRDEWASGWEEAEYSAEYWNEQ